MDKKEQAEKIKGRYIIIGTIITGIFGLLGVVIPLIVSHCSQNPYPPPDNSPSTEQTSDRQVRQTISNLLNNINSNNYDKTHQEVSKHVDLSYEVFLSYDVITESRNTLDIFLNNLLYDSNTYIFKVLEINKKSKVIRVQKIKVK